MPLFKVYLLDSSNQNHPFDARGIEAENPEDALKLALGGALSLSPEDSLEKDLDILKRSYHRQAELDGERGSAAVRVEEIWDRSAGR